jgi:hypothetical protein
MLHGPLWKGVRLTAHEAKPHDTLKGSILDRIGEDLVEQLEREIKQMHGL